MGAPTYPSAAQLAQMQAASELVSEPFHFTYTEGIIGLVIELMPHAIAAITLDFPTKSPEPVSPETGG